MEVMKFLEVLKKEHVKIPGVNQKRRGISRDVQENLMWNFHGSLFLTFKFQKGVTQFCRIYAGGNLISQEFLGE